MDIKKILELSKKTNDLCRISTVDDIEKINNLIGDIGDIIDPLELQLAEKESEKIIGQAKRYMIYKEQGATDTGASNATKKELAGIEAEIVVLDKMLKVGKRNQEQLQKLVACHLGNDKRKRI